MPSYYTTTIRLLFWPGLTWGESPPIQSEGRGGGRRIDGTSCEHAWVCCLLVCVQQILQFCEYDYWWHYWHETVVLQFAFSQRSNVISGHTILMPRCWEGLFHLTLVTGESLTACKNLNLSTLNKQCCCRLEAGTQRDWSWLKLAVVV